MTLSELFQAINAELDKRNMVMNQTPPCDGYRHQMAVKGRFYVVDPAGLTVSTHVDIETFGRALGVLKQDEVVTGL